MDDPGSQLDLSSDTGSSSSGAPQKPERTGRFLGITFECCGVYARIYPNAAGTAYEGRCPRCMAAVQVGIGPEGGSGRFFTASKS